MPIVRVFKLWTSKVAERYSIFCPRSAVTCRSFGVESSHQTDLLAPIQRLAVDLKSKFSKLGSLAGPYADRNECTNPSFESSFAICGLNEIPQLPLWAQNCFPKTCLYHPRVKKGAFSNYFSKNYFKTNFTLVNGGFS